MTADTDALAKRIADALVKLLPTSKWDAVLAAQVIGALGHGDTSRTTTLADDLRVSRDTLDRSDPERWEWAEEEIYVRWRDRLASLLAAEPALREPAELVLETLLAAGGGVRGRRQPVRSGNGHDERRASQKPVTTTRERRLRCEYPENVQLDVNFGVRVRISVAAEGAAGSAPLKSFPVPPDGRDVLLDIMADGMLVCGPFQQRVRVPPDADSEPVRFELRPERPGPAKIAVTAWLDGSFLGEFTADVMVYQGSVLSRTRAGCSGLRKETADGAVTLLVRYEPREQRYRFQFMGVGNPSEVLAPLSWPPDGQVNSLIERVESIKGAAIGDRLVDEGAELWRGILPEQVRQQFWERRDRITQLRILGQEDRVPWELMYPADRGQKDAGFLVEQFPVTRDVFDYPGWARSLAGWPSRFVLPPHSLPAACREVDYLRRLLDAGPEHETVVSTFTPLRQLINSGEFGMLHFACHNNFSTAEGSTIDLNGTPFTITNLQAARNRKTLESSAPLVFINACRSADEAPRYNELAGWAEAFLGAGAGAFIGTLWAVRDASAYTFATTLYELLKEGRTLGEAAMAARAASRKPGDPAWLAYAVYGDPLARMTTGNRGRE